MLGPQTGRERPAFARHYGGAVLLRVHGALRSVAHSGELAKAETLPSSVSLCGRVQAIDRPRSPRRTQKSERVSPPAHYAPRAPRFDCLRKKARLLPTRVGVVRYFSLMGRTPIGEGREPILGSRGIHRRWQLPVERRRMLPGNNHHATSAGPRHADMHRNGRMRSASVIPERRWHIRRYNVRWNQRSKAAHRERGRGSEAATRIPPHGSGRDYLLHPNRPLRIDPRRAARRQETGEHRCPHKDRYHRDICDRVGRLHTIQHASQQAGD